MNVNRITMLVIALLFSSVAVAYLTFASLSDFTVSVIVSDSVQGGTMETVDWEIIGKASSVDIYISYDEGNSFTLLETSVPVDDVFAWNVPNIDHNVVVRVDARNGTTKIRGRGYSEMVSIVRDTSRMADSLKTLEGFDAIAFYYRDREETERGLPSGLEVGDLVKTSSAPAVYFIGGNGERHPFPNEMTFFSWFEGFDAVKMISEEVMASLVLGDTVRVRPGTHLIKVQSLNKVYAVEPGGGLLWIPTEEVARMYFGEEWAKRVVDIPSAYFSSYTNAGELCYECELYPIGSVIRKEGTLWYWAEDGSARPFEGEGFEANGFKERFVIDAIDDTFTRDAGVAIRAHEEVLVDYQDIGR